MNEQELNKKLAEWAGFALVNWERQVHGIVQPWVSLRYPDNTYHDRNDVPNFTQSLDACFKWLVPQTLELIAKKGYCPPTIKLLHLWYDELANLTGDSSNTEQAALALCLAIEKLIDKENV